jgi:hypothetical protein
MALPGYNVKPIQRPLPHGNNQQSPAVQSLIGTVYGGFGSAPRSSGSLGRRRKTNRRTVASAGKKGVSHRARAATSQGKAKANGGANRRRRNAGASRPQRLVAGSAAAKRYMAKIRKLRGKK